MSQKAKYNTSGFQLLTELKTGLVKYPILTAIKILKGQAIHDNGSGYATNTVLALTSLFLGIASATVDNTDGDSGEKYIYIIPPHPAHRFVVPCAADNIMAITDRGSVIDLEAAGTVDNSDTNITSGPGFMVEDIDISAEAVAIVTYGYAIGRFTVVS